jgi:RHS repeat-associated protein
MVTPSDEVYCYHFNATGSTVAMTDSSQTMVNKYAYDPFGKVTNQEEAISQPFKFVGQYGVMTEPNGFYYMRARYYDPQVGRFVSEDPIGFEGGDVNLYAYVGNNPIVLIDPDGLKGGILIPIRKAIKDAFRGNKWVEFLGDTVGKVIQKFINIPLTPTGILLYDYFNPRQAGVPNEEDLLSSRYDSVSALERPSPTELTKISGGWSAGASLSTVSPTSIRDPIVTDMHRSTFGSKQN